MDPQRVRAQLDRILASTAFAGAERPTTFLRFVVERALEGRIEQIKESVIAVEAFKRNASFDPRSDPIVRVEAGRLPDRLKAYYEAEGESVSTEANLALATRKGTGLYKVPSLRGVWYRGLFGHDGAVRTLEEWFDAARLDEDFEPSGFKGYRLSHRAVPGHRYGLDLSEDDKAALIAFLKTL